MISASQLNLLLHRYKQLFPGCVFNADRLSDFLVSEIFELNKNDGRPIGTILESALIVLHKQMVDQKQSVLLKDNGSGVVSAEGFGCRGLDNGEGNKLAEAIIRLTEKVK